MNLADPTADDQTITTDEDTPVSVTLTGSDPGDDDLAYDVTGSPTNGSLSGTAPNLTYTPAANFNGEDTFTFKVSDGDGGDSTGTITINVKAVNDAPVLSAVGDQAADEGGPEEITISATDVDDTVIAFTATGLPGFADLVDNGDNTATLRLAPGYDDAGTYGDIVIAASDGDDTDTETISITINNVNRAPEAVSAELNTSEDEQLSVTLAASDDDGDDLTYVISTPPAHGTLSGEGSTLTYTPDADFNGNDAFTFTVSDGQGGESEARIDIDVAAVNDAPTAKNDTTDTVEDTPVGIDVLANDSDSDGDPLSITSVTQGSHGSVVINGDGTLTYTPDQDYNGSDSFTYVVSDPSGSTYEATVEITDISPVNDAPVITALSEEIIAETELRSVTVTAFDIDGDSIDLSAAGLPVFASFNDNGDGTATLSLAPGYDDAGSYSIVITASDATSSDEAALPVTVTNTNRSPQAGDLDLQLDEDSSSAASLPVSDPDSDPMVYSLLTQPLNGIVLIGNGVATYVPFANYVGPDSFTYTATDPSGAYDIGLVQLNVTAVNDSSQATADNASTLEDQEVVIDVLSNDNDADGDQLTVMSVTQPLSGSTVVINPDGTLTYTPVQNFNGTDTFTYTVTDGHDAGSAGEVTVSVAAVNDEPLAAAGSDITVNEGDPVTLIGTGWDADQDELHYSWTQTSGPAVSLTGSYTYEPSFTAPQVDGNTVLTFNLSVSDGSTICTATVNVTVHNVSSTFERARTIGFWKNHPSRIADILTRGSISLGDTTVTSVSQAVAVLTAANAKDARYQLRAQLLATLLNLRSPSDPMALAPSDIRIVAGNAIDFLATHSLPVGSAHPDRATALSLKDKLDAYNNSGE